MTDAPDSLSSSYRLARLAGFGMCLGTPVLIAALVLSGLVPAGENRPEGSLLQIGHAFTGLVFLSAAWVLWRRGVVLGAFHRVPESQRPRVLLRESLLYSALFELSSFYGLVYWLLVGRYALRHVLGFILLAPLLFLAFVPRLDRWVRASKADPGEAA
ncbi:hypothetical protein [Geothrix sp.]|uniref:hypothetical protein n=1 Tax=Geothrix sp. TaxID=1962974 RepID=UPI0025C18F39|nr:hypothetical protein [Geothrix sp.]